MKQVDYRVQPKEVLTVGRIYPAGVRSRVKETTWADDEGSVIRDIDVIGVPITAKEAWGYLDGEELT